MLKKSILIIEDEEGHIELIKRAFKSYSENFNLIIAPNIKEAFMNIDENPPDLVIADLNLPDGKCIELLTKTDENNKFPMVVMTSHGNERYAVEVMKAGALDYIVKSKETFDNMPWAAQRALREWQRMADHKKAIHELKQSEEKYRTIVEEASDAIFILDHDENIIDINISGEKMLQYARDELLKQKIRTIILKEDLENKELELSELLSGQIVIKEFFFQCKDMSTIPVEISFRKLINGSILGIARNITVRKISELEGRRNREELERFNRLAVGREIRMIELKKEVNRLLLLLGQHERYKIHSPDDILNKG